MAKIKLTGITDTRNRMEKIKFLSIETGLSLLESKQIIARLEMHESVEVEFIGETNAVLDKLSEQNIGFAFYPRYFNEQETIAFIEERIMPELKNYAISKSGNLLDTHNQMVWLIENEAKATFIAEYLIARGIRIEEQL